MGLLNTSAGKTLAWATGELWNRHLFGAFSSLPRGLSIKTPLILHSFSPYLGLACDCFDQWNLEEVMFGGFWAQDTCCSALSHHVRCLCAPALEQGHMERSWSRCCHMENSHLEKYLRLMCAAQWQPHLPTNCKKEKKKKKNKRDQ